jgi:hypothetical protein
MNNETFCAVVEDGSVVNVIVAAADCPILAEHPEWVFLGENPQRVAIGWTYDGEFHAPPQPPAPEIPPIITKLAFRFRLTDAEYVGILQAAKTEVAVQAWVETFNMVSQINLDDPRTVAGVQQLVAAGLLTEQRADEILTTPVVPEERP